MNNATGFAALVKKTIVATSDNGGHGVALHIRFHDMASLSKVMKETTRSADRYNQAVAICSEEMSRWIREASDNGNDMRLFGFARAALRLQELIQAPRHQGWMPDGGGGFQPLA